MLSVLLASAVGFSPVAKAKANVWFRAPTLTASIPEGAAVAMAAPSIFFVASGRERNSHRLQQVP
jgi:hypothetical protein